MPAPDTQSQTDEAIVIKKYANRRLYDTATSRYVTLEHLRSMVKEGADFVVKDAKTGTDITCSVLAQIILEEESKGQNLLPASFLRQIISMYGDNMQWMVPSYLEQSMRAFQANQERVRDYLNSAMGGMFPFTSLEEMNKQNMAIFEQAMRMMAPFSGDDPAQPATPKESSDETVSGDRIEDLKRLEAQIEALQKQFETLMGGGGTGR